MDHTLRRRLEDLGKDLVPLVKKGRPMPHFVHAICEAKGWDTKFATKNIYGSRARESYVHLKRMAKRHFDPDVAQLATDQIREYSRDRRNERIWEITKGVGIGAIVGAAGLYAYSKLQGL